MPADKQKWEDEEETIVSFDRMHRTPADKEREQTADSNTDDEEATIIDKEAAPIEEFDDRTVTGPGARPVQKVEVMAWLVITKTPSVRTGQMFTLDKVRTDIGRGAGVAIFLNDEKIGRMHATVRYELSPDESDRQFVLYDLASTNGTFVNGQCISSPTVLKDGDRITLGGTELAFKRL